MIRRPMTYGGLSAEQEATNLTTSAKQLVDSVTPSAGGSLLDPSAHMAALPAFLFLLVGGGLLFWLIYKTHYSFSASFGRE